MTPKQLHAAYRTLAALQARSGWAYGLAYDRGGARLDGIRRPPGQPAAPPVRITYRSRRGAPPVELISSAADAAWAGAYLKAAKHLAQADRDIAAVATRLGLNHAALATQQITSRDTAPSADGFARICKNIADGLIAIAPRLPHAGASVIAGCAKAVDRINLAAGAIPDLRNPPKPIECRNPNNNSRCDALPVYDKARRLCEPCYRQLQYLERKTG